MNSVKKLTLFSALVPMFLVGACVKSGTSIDLLQNPEATKTSKNEDKIRLVSFHLDGEKRAKLERTGRAVQELELADGDVVLLQDITQGWSKGDDSRAAFDEMGYPFQAFYTFEDRMPVAESSMMVLSKWPVDRAQAFVFKHNSGQRRSGFLMFDVMAPIGTITFIAVQLSNGEKVEIIEQQIEELRRVMDDKIEPDGFVIVAGNIDVDPDGALMKRLQGVGLSVAGEDKGLKENPTYTGNILTPCNVGVGRRADYILFRAPDNDEFQGLRELDSGVNQPEPPYPSSHCPIWADFEIR